MGALCFSLRLFWKICFVWGCQGCCLKNRRSRQTRVNLPLLTRPLKTSLRHTKWMNFVLSHLLFKYLVLLSLFMFILKIYCKVLHTYNFCIYLLFACTQFWYFHFIVLLFSAFKISLSIHTTDRTKPWQYCLHKHNDFNMYLTSTVSTTTGVVSLFKY